MNLRIKGAVVKVGLAITVAMAAPLVSTTVAHAGTGDICPGGDFCAWSKGYWGYYDTTGVQSNLSGNNSSWFGFSSGIVDKDNSWKNKYQSWYYGCAYEYTGYSGIKWVHSVQGEEIPYAGYGNSYSVQNGISFNHDESNHGTYSTYGGCY